MQEKSQPSVEVEFALKVSDGQVKAKAAVPAGQTNITALLPVLQNFESAMLSQVAREADAAGYPISCKAGCGACCRQMVPVSIFEAEALGA